MFPLMHQEVLTLPKHIYVLDSCVLLHDPNAMYKFQENDIYIPLAVIDDLDEIKTKPLSVGWSAREVFRNLAKFNIEQMMTVRGAVANDEGGHIHIFNTEAPLTKGENPNITRVNSDNAIINAAIILKGKFQHRRVTIVTKDTGLLVRALSYGCKAENYQADLIGNEAYSGVRHVEISDKSDWEVLWNTTELAPSKLSPKVQEGLQNLAPHECTIFDWGTMSCPTIHRSGTLFILKDKNHGSDTKKINYTGISPKNLEQRCAIEVLADDTIPLVSLCGPAGTGKAQPLDAHIATPSGFVRMGDIQINQKVSVPSGGTANVIGIFPQGVKPIFKVTFSDGSSTECCDEHLWAVKNEYDRDRHRDFSIKTLHELRHNLRGHDGRKNYSIPMVSHLEFESQNVPIDPYLLGVLLGDGGLTANSIVLSTSDEEILLQISSLLPEDVRIIKISKDSYDYRLSIGEKGGSNPLVNSLRTLNIKDHLSLTKFIPEVYKYNSFESRVSILQGLMDTDGFCGKRGSDTIFYSSSERLSRDVAWIAQSLGAKTRVCNRQTTYTHNGNKLNGKPSFATHISFPPDICPFRLSRKVTRYKPRTKYLPTRYIDTVEYIGDKKAQCILIDHPEHLYVTDDFIVTHNTLLTLAVGLEKLNIGAYNRIIVIKPLIPVGGRDIGALPGDKFEKISAWLGPIKDNIEQLIGEKKDTSSRDGDKRASGASFEEFIQSGKIEVEAMAFIQGRSIPYSLVIVDEAQNLTPRETRMVVERCGKGSKIVLLGDLSQVENSYLDARSCGLAHAMIGGRWQEASASVTLTKVERSHLAAVASQIFNRPEAQR